jgi:hypothetical protein
VDVLCNLVSVLVTKKFLDGSQFEKNAVSPFFLMCGRINEVFVSHVHKTVFYWLGDAVNESGSIHISSIY